MGSACLLYLHAQSPLHMGSGRAEGTIDLPHAREAHTGYPVAPGSGLKGVLRDEFEGDDVELLFGGDIGDAASTAPAAQGALMFSDGALLCLPVRSLLGTFAWVTSPYLLMRYSRDREAVGLKALAGLAACMPGKNEHCTVTGPSAVAHAAGNQSTVYLSDLGLKAESKAVLTEIAALLATACGPSDADDAWRAAFTQRLVVVTDAVLGYLVHMAMETRARVRLEDETKVVRRGHLWYEESLPSETLLYAVVAADPPPAALKGDTATCKTAADVLGRFVSQHARFEQVQAGGKATVGRGWLRTALEREAVKVAS